MYAIYIHIPFCEYRCAYCDFNSYAGKKDLIPNYVEALCREIAMLTTLTEEKLLVSSIFFGGGTPSLLSSSQLIRILSVVQRNFIIQDAEITLEANPGTVSQELLIDIHKAGFNRLSLGVQSFHNQELQFLERKHDPFDVSHSIYMARKARFTNINLDLMYGIPGQTLERWKKNLEYGMLFQPEHISLYSLTVEKSTPLGHWLERGLISPPDSDLAADMYDNATQLLSVHGYEQYEISNWSYPGMNCKHNIQYWKNLPYLGFGAGAHGYAGGIRYSNVQRIQNYINRLYSENNGTLFPLSPAVVDHQRISKVVEMQEFMMLGLRLTRIGVNWNDFYHRFGIEMTEVFGREIERLLTRGLLMWEGDTLHLTDNGRLLGNQVFLNFV